MDIVCDTEGETALAVTGNRVFDQNKKKRKKNPPLDHNSG